MNVSDVWNGLYAQSVQHCQQPFSARMSMPGGRIAYIQQIDEEHQRIEVALRDGVVKIEQAYEDAISKMGENIGMAAGVGAGVCSLVFGIILIGTAPWSWLFGAAFGAGLGGGAGAIGGTLRTLSDRVIVRQKALLVLLQMEVDFVTSKGPELDQKIAEIEVALRQQGNQPDLVCEYEQLKALSAQFRWVLERKNSIAKETPAATDPQSAERWYNAIEAFSKTFHAWNNRDHQEWNKWVSDGRPRNHPRYGYLGGR